MTYYIYEVPGEKIGATKDWESRREYNFNEYQIEPIIVETMEGPDTEDMWQVVGDREWYYADLNGYTRGTHYKVIRILAAKHDWSDDARAIAKRNKAQSKAGKVGGKTTGPKNVQSGHLKSISTLGGHAMAKVINTCEHCGHQGKGANFYRYHAKNCTKKRTTFL